jgi:hypothetical protein
VWSSDLSTINKYRAFLLRNISDSCLATVKLSDTPLEMMTKLNQTYGFGHQNALKLKHRLKEIYFPPTRDPVTIFQMLDQRIENSNQQMRKESKSKGRLKIANSHDHGFCYYNEADAALKFANSANQSGNNYLYHDSGANQHILRSNPMMNYQKYHTRLDQIKLRKLRLERATIKLVIYL